VLFNFLIITNLFLLTDKNKQTTHHYFDLINTNKIYFYWCKINTLSLWKRKTTTERKKKKSNTLVSSRQFSFSYLLTRMSFAGNDRVTSIAILVVRFLFFPFLLYSGSGFPLSPSSSSSSPFSDNKSKQLVFSFVFFMLRSLVLFFSIRKNKKTSWTLI